MKLPLGYRYATAYAGIRKVQKDDVGLIVSDTPASAAAVFTTNVVQAAPIRLARKHLKSSKGRVSAVLINAGNANCATRTGDKVALASAKAVSKALDVKVQHVIPASTGVIGVELDAKLLTGIVPALVSRLSPDAFESVAHAMMTTDTRPKMAWEEVRLRSGIVRVAGMTKGAGMINPKMATTLGFVMTDAAIATNDLRAMLVEATARSYNSLTIDGDMSTNDIVLVMANGASRLDVKAREKEALQTALDSVMESLAKQIAADGEGARKLIIVKAEGFKNTEDAQKVARSISNSPLVKTAIAGTDPNWGRILAAAGYSGVDFDPRDVDVFLQDAEVCRRGLAADFDESSLSSKLDEPEINIRIVLNGKGKGAARFFTCDLTEEYIRINGSYRT